MMRQVTQCKLCIVALMMCCGWELNAAGGTVDPMVCCGRKLDENRGAVGFRKLRR